MPLGHRTSLLRALASDSQDRPLKHKEEWRRGIAISVSLISEHAVNPCRKDSCLVALAHCHAPENFIVGTMATPFFITTVMGMGNTILPYLNPYAWSGSHSGSTAHLPSITARAIPI